jgi:thiol-disulfide isomerase/thioredoxin
MQRSILTFLFLAFSISVMGQKAPDRNGNLVGFLKKVDFLQGSFQSWFEEEYKVYQPKERVVNKIRKELEGIDIKIFMGSWCHDSHREIPRYFKLMEAAGFDLKRHTEIIGLTRGKKTPDNLQEGFNIKHTPTFIFYRDGKEIGRYIEHSRQSMEKDFLKILQGKPYKHAYSK